MGAAHGMHRAELRVGCSRHRRRGRPGAGFARRRSGTIGNFSAHPFENPTSWTNLFEIALLLAISFSFPRTFGKMVGSNKQGYAILTTRRDPGRRRDGVELGARPAHQPDYALLQVDRVAEVRGLEESAVRELVESRIQARDLGYLGEPTVNVLKLNLALVGLG